MWRAKMMVWCGRTWCQEAWNGSYGSGIIDGWQTVMGEVCKNE